MYCAVYVLYVRNSRSTLTCTAVVTTAGQGGSGGWRAEEQTCTGRGQDRRVVVVLRGDDDMDGVVPREQEQGRAGQGMPWPHEGGSMEVCPGAGAGDNRQRAGVWCCWAGGAGQVWAASKASERASSWRHLRSAWRPLPLRWVACAVITLCGRNDHGPASPSPRA